MISFIALEIAYKHTDDEEMKKKKRFASIFFSLTHTQAHE